MATSYIALRIKDANRSNIDIDGIPLVHEAAHVRQFKLPSSFSEEWLGRFPREPRPRASYENDDAYQERNGVVSMYATRDYTNPVDKPRPQRGCGSSPVFVHREDGLPVLEFFGSLDESQVRHIVERFGFNFRALPFGLREFMELVKIDSDLNGPYFYHSEPVSDEYLKTCEDVAETTEAAIVAGLIHGARRGFLDLLEKQPRLKDKVEMLGGSGFLPEGLAPKLSDDKFRRYMRGCPPPHVWAQLSGRQIYSIKEMAF
jgi:hypothetical protein